jgi:hypothetical protein
MKIKKKVNPIIRPKLDEVEEKKPIEEKTNALDKKSTNFLEVDGSKKIDLANIINDNTKKLKSMSVKNMFEKKKICERENSLDFKDDSTVPPLE